MVTFSEELGFSRLFCDYLSQPEKVLSLLDQESIDDKILRLSDRLVLRKDIIEILTRQNQHWQASAAVFDNIKKLEKENSVAVMAGQQACLFGGPYMILLKALATVKYARRVEYKYKIPVVPIFWIVADDHDFKEIASVDIFDTGGKPVNLSIDFNPTQKYPPIGALAYDKSISREVEMLRQLLPDNDFKTLAMNSIEKNFCPGKSIIDGFADYLHEIIGHLGLVFFNPYDQRFKERLMPFFSQVISRHDDIKYLLNTTNDRLEESGYHLQVEKSDTATHLFLHDPARTALHYRDKKYVSGENVYSREQILDWIKTRPMDISYDVITKPLAQSFFFPALAVIGGPAEVAYYAQLMPLFDLFELVPPIIISRPSLTLVESRFERLMRKFDVSFQEIALDINSISDNLIRDSFPEKYRQQLDNYIDQVKSGLDELSADLIKYDPDLKGTFNRADNKIGFHLGELRDKIYAVHKKRKKTERERLERLHNNLYPNRGMAERSIAPVYFISRYGQNVIDFVFNKLDIDTNKHELVKLSEYHE